MPERPCPARPRRLPAPLATILAALLMLPVVPVVRAAPARQADAEERLHQAVEAMATVSTFHFELTTPRGQTLFLDNLELAGLSGDVQRPDRFRATATAKAAIVELNVDVVGIGTRLWITDPTSTEKRYIELSLEKQMGQATLSLADLFNPDRVLLAAVGLVGNPTIAGEDEIDGVATTQIDGTVDLAELTVMGTPVPGLRQSGPLPVSLWIDDAGHVRRMEIAGPLNEAESDEVVRRLDLSAFDQPVDIQPPA